MHVLPLDASSPAPCGCLAQTAQCRDCGARVRRHYMIGWFNHLNYLESWGLAAAVVFAFMLLPALLSGGGAE